MAEEKDPALLAYEQRAAQEAVEYGTWRAKYPIQHDGVIAYMPGHAVPVSNVERYGYDEMGLVERVDDPSDDLVEPDPSAPPQGQTIDGDALKAAEHQPRAPRSRGKSTGS